MLKAYNTSSECQRIIKRKFPTQESFINHFIQFVTSKRSHSKILPVIDYLLSHINQNEIKLKNKTIAQAIGTDKGTVYRSVKALRKASLIWTYRQKDPVLDDRYDALTFEFPSYFYDPSVRIRLESFLKSMKLFLVWTLAISIDAAGRPIRETAYGFSYSYIREEKTKSKIKPKRQSCIITASGLGRASVSETGEAALRGRVSAPLGSAASEPPYFYYYYQQPATNSNREKERDGMRMILRKVVDMVPEVDEHLAQLDDYSDPAIQHALNKLKRAKNVRDAAAYFMYILKNDAQLEHQNPSIAQQLASSSTREKNHKQESRGELTTAQRYTLAQHYEQPEPVVVSPKERLLEELAKVDIDIIKAMAQVNEFKVTMPGQLFFAQAMLNRYLNNKRELEEQLNQLE